MPSPDLPLLAVVGSRKYSTYGRQVTEHLIAGLTSYHVGIVSGLAIGIDGIAHEAALAAGLYTLAVPGSGLGDKVLYPRRHYALAEKIVARGGGLLSELPPTTPSADWTFPARNRIMAGMCQATLLIEAGEKSGTLITARLATDYNREVLVVPGSIFSSSSFGTHQFLKLGATPITTSTDIVDALSLIPRIDTVNTTISIPDYATPVLVHLNEPKPRDTLIRLLNLPITEASTLLMRLEIEGIIMEVNGTYTTLHHPSPHSTPNTSFDSTDKT